MDIVDKIMQYESGIQPFDETVAMFAEMVKTGLCWELQGHYGRVAVHMIAQGHISTDGDVLSEPTEV